MQKKKKIRKTISCSCQKVQRNRPLLVVVFNFASTSIVQCKNAKISK